MDFFGRIVFIYLYGTTFSAARTFFKINISGLSSDFYLEVSLGSVDFFYL